MSTPTQTIAVIFGGRSAEHDVSIVTAIASIIRPLELSRKYRVEPVYIAKSGAWYWGPELKDISLFSSGKIEEYMRKSPCAAVMFDGGMWLRKGNGAVGRGRAQHRKIDVVFPAMHGTYGEDGSLMGLLDMAGVPYVGCGLEASALAMNKVLSKQIVSAYGIPVAAFLHCTNTDIEQAPDVTVNRIKKTLHYPVFVKPAHLGSSIGISRAANDTELRNGLEVAARYDTTIIVEEAVQNLIEVTLPIMGNHELTPAYLEQPMVTAEDFFDFDTKYMNQGGGKKTGGKAAASKQGAQGYSQIPAHLPDALYRKAEQMGLDVYKALGCSGTARVDMLIDSKTKRVYFNEVNPLPGSLYAHNWRKKGVSNVELVTRLVTLAGERAQERRAVGTVFPTNFLQQF